LRNPTETWDGVMFLLTCGVLTLAIVGVVCRDGAKRAWWLGFALFGWGYLALAFSSPHQVLPELPTTAVLQLVVPKLIGPGLMGGSIGGPDFMGGSVGGSFRSIIPWGGFGGMGGGSFVGLAPWRIGHCLWSLLAAVVGGTLARFLFGAPAERPEAPTAESHPGPLPLQARKWWRRPALIGLGGLVLFAAVAWIGLRSAPGLWAGGTFLLTWALIALAALGAVYGRRNRRAPWLGATLFGTGLMFLVFGARFSDEPAPRPVTNHLLNAIRASLPDRVTEIPASSKGVAAANARIRQALERPVALVFPNETPLEDVLKSIEEQTEDRDGRRIAIYVDPVGLNEAEKTGFSPIAINLVDVPLKTSLTLALKQLGLTYHIWEGVLVITSELPDDPLPVYDDPFLTVGNCLLALLAAGLGGVLAPLVARRTSGSIAFQRGRLNRVEGS
jgi:hypothetical protein